MLKKSKYYLSKTPKTKTQKSLINIFLTKMTKKTEKNFKDLHKSVLLNELVDAMNVKKSGRMKKGVRMEHSVPITLTP